MEVLLEALAPYSCSAIAGDFNYDPDLDSPDMDLLAHHYVDVWTALRGKDPGFTFDAEANPTAAITSKASKRRRYDRVCVRKDVMTPLSVRLFGTQRCVAGGRLCPSDHYGVSACIALPKGAPLRQFASLESLLEAQARAIGSAEAETARRMQIAHKLEGILGTPVTVVGSTALGCVLKDSDLDCVVDKPLGEVYRVLSGASVLLEPNTDSDVVRASLDGVHVDIQLPGDGAAVRDLQSLLRAFGTHHKAYVAALCFLKLWAQRVGIYGNVYGYPNGLALAVMLVRCSQDARTPDALVRNFFEFYAHYDWKQPILADPQVHYQSRSNDHLRVGTPSSGVSIVRNATKSSLLVFQSAVREASKLELAAMLMLWREPNGHHTFYHSHPCYVHVEILSNTRATLAKVVGLIIGLEASKGIPCHVYSHIHQHADSDSACVLIGVDCELLELPALLSDENAICTIQFYPTCRKRFHFSTETSSSSRPVVDNINNDNNNINNDNNAIGAAVAAPTEEKEAPIDFEVLAASCKTSDELLKMIKWHPAFGGGEQSEIGWDDRFLGLIRKPVASYIPGGAVPFHRVMCFWHEGKLIWWRGEKEQYLHVVPKKDEPEKKEKKGKK